MAKFLRSQFDVYRNPRGGDYPYLLDVQADLLSRLGTRVVVPLVVRDDTLEPITRLNPVAMVGGVEHVLVSQELAGLPEAALGEKVESLSAQRSELVAALDLLFTGI